MAQQIINAGLVANDGTGDPLRSAFGKVNANFLELYARSVGGAPLALAPVALSGAYADLIGKPAIPVAPNLAPYVLTTSLPPVALSGAYADLTGKPTLPVAPGLATATTPGMVKGGGNVTIAVDGTMTVAAGGGAASPASTIILTLSTAGIVSDATNGLDYGALAPAGATGQEVAIQAAIDRVSAAAAVLGTGVGIRIEWDVAVALGQEIRLGSNMTVFCPNQGCGAIMRAGANTACLMLKGMDADMGAGAYQGGNNLASQNTFGKFDPAWAGKTNPHYHRIFDRGFVNARNIVVDGGTWNGNHDQQTKQPDNNNNAAAVYFVQARNVGYPSVMHFFGVDGLAIRNARLFLGAHFGAYLVNCGHVRISNCEFDQHQDNNYGTDPIHCGGPVIDMVIEGCSTHGGDDQIALNADDIGNTNPSQGIVPGGNWQCSGPITGVRVRNHQFTSGRENSLSSGGVCFRSTVTLIDDIAIDSLSGVVTNWLIWAPAAPSFPWLTAGPGNIGHILLRNIECDLYNATNSPGVISIEVNSETWCIDGRTRRSAQNCPDIVVKQGAVVQQLLIGGYSGYMPADNANAVPALRVDGEVKQLYFQGASRRVETLSIADAPALLVTGSGIVRSALVDVQQNRTTAVVRNNGTIGSLVMRGAYEDAGGAAPVANAGTISILKAGGMLYAGSQAYSGAAPATVADATAGSSGTTTTTQPPASGGGLLLDSLSAPAKSAVGLRKLRAAFAGSAIRVVRSSDSTTADIGFNGNGLDTAALLTFAGTGDATVSIWYDQMNGFNLQQTTVAQQPKIVVAGAVVMSGGKPALRFAGGQNMASSGAAFGAVGNAITACAVGDFDTGTGGVMATMMDYAATSYDTPGTAQMITGGTGPANIGLFRNNVGASSNTAAVNSLFTAKSAFDGSTAGISINGGTPSTAASSGTFANDRNFLLIGAGFSNNPGGAISPMTGHVSETVLFLSAISAGDASAVQTSQKTYYGTP